MSPVYCPFVGPVFSSFSSLDKSTELIPCIRFVIQQNGRSFENPPLLDFSRTDTRFVGWNFACDVIHWYEVFPCVVAATDQRGNTKLLIFKYINTEKAVKSMQLSLCILSTEDGADDWTGSWRTVLVRCHLGWSQWPTVN